MPDGRRPKVRERKRNERKGKEVGKSISPFGVGIGDLGFGIWDLGVIPPHHLHRHLYHHHHLHHLHRLHHHHEFMTFIGPLRQESRRPDSGLKRLGARLMDAWHAVSHGLHVPLQTYHRSSNIIHSYTHTRLPFQLIGLQTAHTE